jgi:hypothetical protein
MRSGMNETQDDGSKAAGFNPLGRPVVITAPLPKSQVFRQQRSLFRHLRCPQIFLHRQRRSRAFFNRL